MSRILRRNSVFTTPWFEIIEKSVEGQELPYYSVKVCNYVTVLSVTEDGRIPMIRQYRPAVESYTLELPSGGVEEFETPLSAARRELLEETGFVANQLELLGTLFPDTGRLETKLWCYFAPGVRSNGINIEEGLELVFCRKEELQSVIASGQMTNALDLAAITLALMQSKLTPLVSVPPDES